MKRLLMLTTLLLTLLNGLSLAEPHSARAQTGQPNLQSTIKLPVTVAVNQPVEFEIIVKNVGTAAVTQGFSVDFFINPNDPQGLLTRGGRWDGDENLSTLADPLGKQGISWFVATPNFGGSLCSGCSVTLVSIPNGSVGLNGRIGYDMDQTTWHGRFISGTHTLVSYADTFGGSGKNVYIVSESNENDNANLITNPLDEVSTPTSTSTATATSTSTNTPTVTNTPTDTPIPPTPTDTPPPTATNTPIPPTATNTPIPTPTPKVAPPDAYESDNNCPEAKPINTDGVPQTHTFHAPNDQDWLSFQATAGISYVIRADIAASSKTDLIGELYGDCGTIIEPGQNPSFSGGVFYNNLIPKTSGTYHLHLLNDKPDVFGADIAYNVSVRPQLTRQDAGVLVMVTGRKESADDKDLQANLQTISKQVYQLWRNKGQPAERIYALATDLNLDLDGDKQADVRGLANNANLKQVITEWTKDKGLGPDRAFTLYLIDHGGKGGRFYLDKPRFEELQSEDLASWLTTLETQAPGVKVNVIIEACYGGGFMYNAARPRLLQPLQILSGPNRVIITSADAVSLAFASDTGGAFSDSFLSGLQQDLSLSDAFSMGRVAAKMRESSQNAMLDGDGDGIPNQQTDFAAAARRGFSFSGSFADTELWPPYIKEVTVTAQANGLAEIKAEIFDKETNDTGLKVWAVIYPPSYRPPTDSELLVPSPLPVNLFSRGNHQFAVNYPAFTEQGTYRVVIQAQDKDDLLGQPYQVEFSRAKSLLYLPLILK